MSALDEEVVAELTREVDRLLLPLVGRMGEVAEALDRDRPVAGAYVGRGIGLWSRYGSEVHPVRVAAVLGPISTTLDLGPAPAGRGRHPPSGAEETESPAEMLLRDYQSIVHNQSLAAERVGELELLRTLYEEGGYGAAARLASVVKAFVVSEEAWARFEVDAARRLITVGRLDPVAPRVREGLERARVACDRLFPDVARYVAEQIPVTVPPGPPDARWVALPASSEALPTRSPRRRTPVPAA